MACQFVHSLISLASLYWAPVSQHASLHVPQDFCTSHSPRLLSLSYVPGFSIGQPRLPRQNTAAWEASTELHGLTVSGVKSPSSKCWLIGFEGSLLACSHLPRCCVLSFVCSRDVQVGDSTAHLDRTNSFKLPSLGYHVTLQHPGGPQF